MDNFFHEEKNDEITTWDQNERKRLPTLNYLLDEILYGYGFSYVHLRWWLLYSILKGRSPWSQLGLCMQGHPLQRPNFWEMMVLDSWKTLTGFACTSCTPPAVRPEVSNWLNTSWVIWQWQWKLIPRVSRGSTVFLPVCFTLSDAAATCEHASRFTPF